MIDWLTDWTLFLNCEDISTKDWLIDWTLFLNGEDISTKADSHICCCYSATNNQNIHSEILWQKAIDKYNISKNNNTYKTRQRLQMKKQWKTTGAKKV